MIKNVIIAILTAILIFFAVLASIKAGEAEMQHIQGKLHLEKAQIERQKAKTAMDHAREAERKAWNENKELLKKIEALEEKLAKCKN